MKGWFKTIARLSPFRVGSMPPPAPLVRFEPLEPRLLLAGDLPSFTLIEADNRGLIAITANADLDILTINTSSVHVTTAGGDQIFGTSDDVLVQRTVSYDQPSRQIRISANVAADQRYRVRLDSSIIRDVTGRAIDGEFTGAATVSGDAVAGGDLIFFSRRPAEAVARFTTISGIIDVTLFRDRTPLTVQNFLNYANRGVWDTTIIHRSVPGFVIQGGGFINTPPFSRIPQDPPVLNEPGITNTRGRISMAKLGGNPNSATNEWFFNLGNNASNLDNQNGGFTAFGEVRNAAGLAVMDALAAFQIVNAQGVQSAFNEIPVVDRNAVLARPGGISLLPSDVIFISRIALLVDVSGEPSQQLNPSGSVTVGAPNGGAASLQVFDLDNAGLGDLNGAIDVRFGRAGAISSITIRDGLPAARIGIVITGATSIGSITDARRNPAGNIAFITSSAPVGTITLNAPLTGFNLNGVVAPGLVFNEDIDGDGSQDDLTAIFVQSGFTSSIILRAGVTGDVIIEGGIGTANVGGTARNADFDGGVAPSNTVSSFIFATASDVEVRITNPISSIRAAQWLDTGGRQERIAATSIGSVNITGDARNALPGDFEASIDLTSVPQNRPILGSITIAGSIFGSDWALRGPVGSVLIRGDATNWTLTNASTINALSVGRVANSTLTASGRISRFTAVDWQGGSVGAASILVFNVTGDARRSIAGDFIANLNITGVQGTAPVVRTLTINGALRNSQTNIQGTVTNMFVRGGFDTTVFRLTAGELRTFETRVIQTSTINIAGTSHSFVAARIENSVIQGNTYRSLVVRGDARAGIEGDVVAGDFRPQVTERIDIQGDFNGVMNIRNAGTVLIGGNVTGSSLNFTQTPSLTAQGFQSFGVGGAFENSEIRITGRVGSFTTTTMINSGLYVGAPAGSVGLPNDGTGFRAGSRIETVLVKGAAAGLPGFAHSVIVANELGSVRLSGVEPENLDQPFGIAAGIIDTAEIRTTSGVVQRLNSRSASPAPIGDFNVWLAFMQPAPTA